MHRAIFPALALLVATPVAAAQDLAEFTGNREGPKVSVFRDTPPAQDPIQDKITPGMRAVTIRVRETAGTAGFVFPGDRVDIMLILAEGSGRSRPYPFLRDVRVLDVEQVIEDERVVDLVTVEVTIDQARQLTKAQKADSITLVLRISGPPARPAGP